MVDGVAKVVWGKGLDNLALEQVRDDDKEVGGERVSLT